jgi:hypothetical protein
MKKFLDDEFWDRLHLWAQVWVLLLLTYAVVVKADAIVMYLCGLAATLVTGTGVVHGWKEVQRIRTNGKEGSPPAPIGGFKPEA